MSTLEKAMNLLQLMPESKVENAYMYIRFLYSQTESNESSLAGKGESPTVEMTHEYTKPNKKDVHAMLGIAHELANSALIEQEEGAFERAMVEKHAADSTL